MSVAAKPEAAKTPLGTPRIADPFRAPYVRHAMHLIVPKANGKAARLVVLEMKAGVRLSLDMDDDGIGVKHVDLSFTEAVKLADMLNTIRRRAWDRKEWLP